MKYIVLSLLTITIFSAGCSFKKENNPATLPASVVVEKDMTPTIDLFRAIYDGSPQQVAKALEKIDTNTLSTLSLDKVSLFDAAASRGNASILTILLEKGLSPFSTNTQDHIKPYQKISNSYSNIGGDLGAWIFSRYLKILSQDDPELIKKDFQQWQMDCTDLLNLHSWFSQYGKEASTHSIRVKNMFKYLSCKIQPNEQLLANWTKGEVITLLNNPERELFYLDFLESLGSFQNIIFSFETHLGKMSLKPATLIKIMATLPSYQGTPIDSSRLKKIASFFEEDLEGVVKLNNGVKIENLSVTSPTELIKIHELMDTALNRVYLEKSENCYFMCNSALVLDSKPNF